MNEISNDTSRDTSAQLPAILMGVAADGQPLLFQPHSTLCAAFAERTAAYLRELEALGAEVRDVAAAIPAAIPAAAPVTPAVAPVTRYHPRQPTARQRLHAERQAHLQAHLQRLVAHVTALRAELNAWFLGAALACPACATALSAQPWPLPGSEELLSEVLRAELRQRRAAQS